MAMMQAELQKQMSEAGMPDGIEGISQEQIMALMAEEMQKQMSQGGEMPEGMEGMSQEDIMRKM
jgi:hypothetical protein